MKALFDLVEELFQKGTPGKLSCVVKFKNPANRINLPLFPSEKGGRDFIYYQKGEQWYFVVMTHAQTVNQFESALLQSFQDRQTRYPEVVINFKEAVLKHNLIHEPHRIYSAFLAQPHKDYYVSWGKDKFPKTELYKALYGTNPVEQLRAIAKYSPLTVLFGGYGSHSNFSRPPKYTSLIETEIYGVSLGGKDVQPRRGQGAFMPPLGVPEKVPPPKGIKWSGLGMNTVPMTLNESSRGAVALKDITLEANLILDRLCALRLEKQEESIDLKMYMMALWLHLFWLGYKRGFSHYQGRELVADSYEFVLDCPKPYSFPKLAKALTELDPDTCAKFYDFALERVVKTGLVELRPLQLEASPKLDEAMVLAARPKESKSEEETSEE